MITTRTFTAALTLWILIGATAGMAAVATASSVTVTRSGSGSGTVSSDVGNLSCGATCTAPYPDGTLVTLAATPSGDSQFTGWLGACTGIGPCHITVNGNAAVVATFASTAIFGAPTLDVDGSTRCDAFTDGLLVVRHLFGLTGTPLIAGAVASSATRTTATQIGGYLADLMPALDIDGNGHADALTDGLLITRYLLGLRGDSLIAGAVGPGAIRTGAADLVAQMGPLMCASNLNQPPIVSAGASQAIVLPAVVSLAGTATDDGLPNPPGKLATVWSKVSGPAPDVLFGDPSALATTATFQAPGTYVLRLTASDGAKASSSDLSVTVGDSPPLFLSVPDRTIALGTRYQQLLSAGDGNVGDALVYSLLASPAGAALSPSPLVDWTPTAAQLGVNTFTAKVVDTAGHSATTTFHVTVVSNNRPPTLAPQANVVMAIGSPFARTLQASDPDAGDTLTFALVAGGPGMTLSGASVNWATTGKAAGDYPVTVKVTDAAGLSDSKLFTITLTPAPPAVVPPIARDDSYSVKVGGMLLVTPPGVLANDTDANGAALTAAKITNPALGTLEAFTAGGGFSYQAPAALPVTPLAMTKLWNVGGGSDRYHELVADLNGDSYPDIVSSDNNGGIRARSGRDGSELWSADRTGATDCALIVAAGSMESKVLADLDDSGHPALALTTGCGRAGSTWYDNIVAIDHLGKVKWVSAPLSKPHPDIVRGATPVPPGGFTPGGLAYGRGLSVARLTAGGPPVLLMRAEIPVNWGFSTYYDANNVFHYVGCRAVTGLPADENVACRATFIISGTDGSVLQTLVVRNPAAADAHYGTGPNSLLELPPIAMDIDGDGRVDLVSGTEVWMQNAAGGFDLAWQLTTSVNDTAVADLDGDGKAEIIHLRASGFPEDDRGIFIYSHDGKLKRRIPLWAFWVTPLTIADVDGDGRSDIVVGGDGTLFAFRDDGRPIWAYKVPDEIPDNPVFAPYYNQPAPSLRVTNAAPQVYDLDGDGVAEVIFAAHSRIMILDGRTGVRKIPPYWNYAFSYHDISGLMLVDMNNDGHIDIVQNASFIFNCGFVGADFATQCNNLVGPTVLHGGGGNNWRPGPKAYPHVQYRSTAISDTARVLHDTRVSRVFRVPEQQGTVGDPRLAQAAGFTYTASNGGATSLPARVVIDIVPDNQPPVFTSTPPKSLWQHFSPTPPGALVTHYYDLAAYDPDPGDTVTFSLKSAPTWVTLSGPAQIRFEPTCGSYGSPCPWGWTTVIVTATDSRGAATDQFFIVNLTTGSVTVPNVVGMMFEAAKTALIAQDLQGVQWALATSAQPVGTVIQQEAVAGAVVGRFDDIRLTLSSGPKLTTVPFVVGKKILPANSQLAALGFTVAVTTQFSTTIPVNQVMAQSPAAGTAMVASPANPVGLTVSAGAPLSLPIAQIVLEPGPRAALRVAGDELQYKAIAILTDGTSADVTLIVAWSSSVAGVAAIGVTGNAKTIAAGATTISAALAGKTGQATLNVVSGAGSDSTPPVAAITAPVDGSTVTGPVSIVGTASDSSFARYEVAIGTVGSDDWRLIAEGTVAVTNGVLGTLDPTLLLNGAYRLRLTVFDRGSNTSTAEVAVLVDGNQKVGYFTLSYTDLVVPLAGLPIQVTRTYDSRDAQKGDFGIGWSMGLKAIRVSATRELGGGWQVDKAGLNYNLVSGGARVVSVTLPNGRVESFDLRITPSVSPLAPFATVKASFVARSGTLGTLRALENIDLLVVGAQPGEVMLVDDGSLNTFDPDRFVYTQPDGTQFVVRRESGVESVKDANGNTITITPGGISHSSGASIVFTRDAEDRITSITDPKGMSRTYAYSGAGDLAQTTDRLSNVTGYFYNRSHGLLRVVDPLGQTATRMDYDAEGRLIALTDANGQVTHYQHNVAGRQQLIEDPLGRITAFSYDARGNVLARTDPLGNTSTFTYDARDNLLSRTDPLGAVTTYTYDAQNNLTSATDPLGRKTTSTFDSGGRALTVTDARGFTSQSRYDATGQLAGTTDALGNTRAFARNASGALTTLTSPTGAQRNNVYDTAGRRTALTDALGVAITLQYDANGNLLSQQAAGAPAATISYDAEGRVTGTSRDGLQRSVAYDGAGRINAATTSGNRQLALAADPVGRLTSIADPVDGVALQLTYDAVGNLTGIGGATGNRLTNVYDAADRLIESRSPDGSVERRSYDAAGRLLQHTDARGNVTRRSYDAAGQLASTTDALGGVTLFQYDLNGNNTAQTDPAGRTTAFEYDALNRLTRTTFADGRTELRAYDAGGRLLTLTDPLGHVTSYTYDSEGHLLSVTDALGQITRHAYMGGSQRSETTDAMGHRTTFAYDQAGRLVSTTYPLGGIETSLYDVAGRLLSKTNAQGESTQYQYDARGRHSQTTVPGGVTETYGYTSDHLLATIGDGRGATTLDYDAQTRRLVRVTEPDGRHVRYAHDAAGNKTLIAHGDAATELVTQYQYDALNRLTRITDPAGGVTTQAWDSVGNLTTVIRPNGVKSETAYDARNRPVSVTHRDPANAVIWRESYTLDGLGNRTRIDLVDGARVEYRYDALSRVTSEKRFDSAGTMTSEAAFAYDAAGNLTSAGPPAAPVLYTYNADNQLTSAGSVSYAYDAAGRRITESWTPVGGSPQTIRYHWDARDRMTSYRDASGATTTYAYDDAGLRVGRSGPSGAGNALLDRTSPTGYPQLVSRTTAQGTDTFVWGNAMVAAIEAGTPRYPLFDALGSTRALTGANGAVTDKADYTAYGERINASGASGLPHRFAGEETDPESGLTYLRARYYDPRSRRMLTRDAKPGLPDEPLSLNPYLYVGDNPVNRTDPSGNDFSLAGTLFASAQSLQLRAQEFINKRKAMVNADKAALNTIRTFAGVMAIDAVVENLGGDNSKINDWFGGGLLGAGFLAALPEIGSAVSMGVHVIADGVMAATAMKLLLGETVQFRHEGVGILLSGSVAEAQEQWKLDADAANTCKQKKGQGLAWAIRSTKPQIVEFCVEFFTMPPLPTRATMTREGYGSMPGIMLHEFTHLAAGTYDNAYFCGSKKLMGLKLKFGFGSGAAVFNADSYRCWAEDVALGWTGSSSLPKKWE